MKQPTLTMPNSRYLRTIAKFITVHGRTLSLLALALALVAGLLLYRLGTLVPGLSPIEHASSKAIYGWDGLYHHPFDLPLTIIRSIVFSITNHHGAFLTRLPNTLFGLMSIGLVGVLIKFWHGNRTAILATALYACNAWLLHISRLASSDVLYLWAIPLLLVLQLLMLRYGKRRLVLFGGMATCGLLLYIPGMVWFVLLSLYWQRGAIQAGWKQFTKQWQRGLYAMSGLIWLPLLFARLTTLTSLKTWVGLPQHFDISLIGHQLAFIPVHLLIRGPIDSQRWLGHAPLLDIFSLTIVVTGIWFYVSRFRATRSRLLGSYGLLAVVLVALGGPVGLSVLVPLLYILAATGIAYLLYEWLRVFPKNPIARRLGIGLVSVAVLVSCSYNLRAYFVAWPHNRTTLSTFAILEP
jgi:hypothetical protein